jgi:hypothetical protein
MRSSSAQIHSSAHIHEELERSGVMLFLGFVLFRVYLGDINYAPCAPSCHEQSIIPLAHHQSSLFHERANSPFGDIPN